MPIKTKVDSIINSLGSISIQDFVELSNFDSEGFYNSNEESKISTKGHFITSPEITPLFGYSLCNQFIREFHDKDVHLIELGPGNGTLMSDIYKYLESKDNNISQVSLLEKSTYFREKLKKKFSFNINFLNHLSEINLKNNEVLFVYSNEFFDSISSKQYIFKNNNFYEIKITKKNNTYELIYEESLLSDYLKKFYSEYIFEDNDILEHSNLLINYLEDLKSILKGNFFFSATDYGYQKLPKKSTLRLISNHQKIKLFDKFENIDYSFGVNFNLIENTFKKFNPILISQKELITKYLPNNFQQSRQNETEKAIDIISGKIFSDMGDSFNNISFFYNEKNL